jgi:hypothetical protein
MTVKFEVGSKNRTLEAVVHYGTIDQQIRSVSASKKLARIV